MSSRTLATAAGKLADPDGPESPVVASYGAGPWPSEASDDYPDIVATLLDGKQRVIAADIQWIVQARRPNGRWFNRYFCRTKEGLLLYAGRTKPDEAPPPPPPELLALPDRFPEGAPTTSSSRH